MSPSTTNGASGPAGANGRVASVVIVGAGPVGLTLANILGLHGVKTLVVEQRSTLIDYPRGVGIDDESLRAFQAIGLIDHDKGSRITDSILLLAILS